MGTRGDSRRSSRSAWAPRPGLSPGVRGDWNARPQNSRLASELRCRGERRSGSCRVDASGHRLTKSRPGRSANPPGARRVRPSRSIAEDHVKGSSTSGQGKRCMTFRTRAACGGGGQAEEGEEPAGSVTYWPRGPVAHWPSDGTLWSPASEGPASVPRRNREKLLGTSSRSWFVARRFGDARDGRVLPSSVVRFPGARWASSWAPPLLNFLTSYFMA